MTIKHFTTNNPGWFSTTLQDQYGGQDISVSAGYEMYEFMEWWKEWKEVFKNQHPSVQDSIHQLKVVHELSKQQTDAKTYSWTETTL
jgi:hypothetical protein